MKGTPVDSFEEVGGPIADSDRFMSDATWWEWAERVAAEVDERNAWFLLGTTSAGSDVIVIDVLDHAGRDSLGHDRLSVALYRKLRGRNVRHVRFFRWAGVS